MNSTIIKTIEPFPYLIIEDLYSEKELAYIWQELDFLTNPSKLEPSEHIAPTYYYNPPLKQNSSLSLDEIYSKRKISNILTTNKKIFDKQILDEFSDLCFSYQNINETNFDVTLLSYYENGGYYNEHSDSALYTCITWFFKEPKAFSGGDFNFNQYDIKMEIKNNMSVIFPSFVSHSFDEIKMSEDFDLQLSGYGMYSMTQFLYIKKN